MKVLERLDAGALAFLTIAKAQASAKRACNRAAGFLKVGRRAAAVAAMGAASSVFAAGPDLTTVTTAVDFGTVTTAVLAVAASLIVVYISWKGAKMVIAAVRGG